MFCESCFLPTCRDCAFTDHRGHDMWPVAESAGKHREKLQKALMKTETQMADLEVTLHGVEEAGGVLRQRAKELRGEVETFIEGYVNALREHKAQLIRDIEEEVEQREQVLKLRGARIQQQLQDLHIAKDFTRDLVGQGPDFHLLNAQGLALSRMKELIQGTPREVELEDPSAIQFSPGEVAGLCQGYRMFGALQGKGVDPARCEAQGEGLRSVLIGQVKSFLLCCKDTCGVPVHLGGLQPSVTIMYKDSARSISPSIEENQDGTYLISYRAPVPGELSVSVYVRGRHIQGSPFKVKVTERSYRHSGIYHCCTFCSSGGQKDARCGCGGTMPGGYLGCGHGHMGHPGHFHWSCCGAAMEKSDCLGVCALAPRGLLRSVVL
ncbi:hypothetical protein GDO86_017912 [Hymenochirus boettgeri]|uniref:RING-type E3 ubiquitin transferase n=1 Tax=Hymenochirus boettgeri TaxID=247094 RepID=A0A8T2IFA8_9PIPI|nr:hypothetical protein GDO86_017912 [Hymenochirus boettgeri]